jgi:hypothetical protein
MFTVHYSASLLSLAVSSHWSRCITVDVVPSGKGFDVVVGGEDKVLAASPAAENALKMIPLWEAEVARLSGIVDANDPPLAALAADATDGDKAQRARDVAARKSAVTAALAALDDEYPVGSTVGVAKPYKGGARKALSHAKDAIPKLVWNDEAARPRAFVLASSDDKSAADSVAADLVAFFDVDDDSPAATDRFGKLTTDDSRAAVFALLPIFGDAPRVEFVGTRDGWNQPADKRPRAKRSKIDRVAERAAYEASILETLAKIIPDPAARGAAISGLMADYDRTHK